MAVSMGYQFFLTSDETVDVVRAFVCSSDLVLYCQLRRPGLILVPAGDLWQCADEGPPRLVMTSQALPALPQQQAYDAANTLGLTVVSLPFVSNGRLYLGSIGAKFDDKKAPDIAAARSLIRDIKRRSPRKVQVRTVDSTEFVAAVGVGGSDAAFELATSEGLELCQFGVNRIRFAPA
jgi:hypothetical protein